MATRKPDPIAQQMARQFQEEFRKQWDRENPTDLATAMYGRGPKHLDHSTRGAVSPLGTGVAKPASETKR